MENNLKVAVSGNGKMSNKEVAELYHALDNLDENTDKMVTNDSDVHNVMMPEAIEVDEDSILYPKNERITMEDGTETPAVDNIKPSEANFMEALKPYGFTDEETKDFMGIISDYNRGVRTGLYSRFPKEARNIIDNLISMSKAQGQKISKDNAVNIILDSFINDAKINAAFDEYQENVTDTLLSVDAEMKNIIKESIDDIRNIIPEVQKENPEKAEQLTTILTAFEKAKTFELQMDCLKKFNWKKLMKAADRLKNECFYFNKKVNSSDFGIKVPDIKRIIPVLQNAFMEYEDEVLAGFLVLICESTIKMDMTKLENVAYVYRMISDIVSYEYTMNFESAEAKELFGNIGNVLLEIEKLK